MSDFLTWDQDISEEGKENKGFVVHETGEYNFKVTKFEKGNVDNADSKYNKAYLAKLTLNAEGSTVFVNLILHKDLDWKIGALFRSLGLMDFKPNERWSKVLGSTGRAKFQKVEFFHNGEDKVKNELEYFIDKAPDTGFPAGSSDSAPPASPEEKLPWE